MDRPNLNVNSPIDAIVTTPSAGQLIQLLGIGATLKNVALSSDEFRAIQKLYDVKAENQTPAQVAAFHNAGTTRNLLRHAECDGLRMLAWIARFVPKGEDPLRTLIQLAADAGLDVQPEDVDWASE